MREIQAPPDATVFRSAGRTYYLQMGALEMRALQREWGLTRGNVDSGEAWTKKQQEFQDRLDGGSMEDKFSILKCALGRWAVAAGEEMDEAKAAEIFDSLEQPAGEMKAQFVLFNALHLQFIHESFGFVERKRPQAEGEPGPKGQRKKGSTQSGS